MDERTTSGQKPAEDETAPSLEVPAYEGSTSAAEDASQRAAVSADDEAARIGPDGQPVGPDNIREGRVRGVMGGPHQQGGEGQG